MLRLRTAVALVGGLIFSSSATLAWKFNDIEGRGVGTLNACAATHVFRDAFITVRLYGDQMDMVFQVDEFTLPYGEVLGPVGIKIDEVEYLGVARSFARRETDVRATTSAMQIVLKKEEYRDLFDVLRAGRNLTLTFPSGDYYVITLQGSARALDRASDCWKEKDTGPDEKNPFAQPESHNPFGEDQAVTEHSFDKDV